MKEKKKTGKEKEEKKRTYIKKNEINKRRGEK